MSDGTFDVESLLSQAAQGKLGAPKPAFTDVIDVSASKPSHDPNAQPGEPGSELAPSLIGNGGSGGNGSENDQAGTAPFSVEDILHKASIGKLDALPDVTLPGQEAAADHVKPGQRSDWSGVIGAALRRGAASAVGAPLDAIAGIVAGPVDNGPGKPYGLASPVTNFLTNLVGNPGDVVNDTPAKRLAAAAAENVPGMLAYGGSAPGPGALRTAAKLIPESLIGAASGAGGSIAEDAAPEPLKPYANLLGQTAAGTAQGAVNHGIGAAYDAAAPLVRNAAAPFTAAGQQAAAARRVAPLKTPANVDAVNNPSGGIEGSPKTTFQVTGDPGIGTAEKVFANKPGYKPGFDAIRAEQNSAQAAHLSAQDAGEPVNQIVPWFRQRLADLRDAEAAENGTLAGAARAAVDSAGSPVPAHQAGGVVRGAVADRYAPAYDALDWAEGTAQARAEGATEALGGDVAATEGDRSTALQRFGRRIRGALNERNEQARAVVSRLYDQVDPDGNLAVDMTAIKGAARDIAKDRPKNSAPLNGDAAAVLGTMQMQPKVQTFKEVAALRSRITDAMRTERSANGRSQTYRALSRLLEAVDDTLTKGVEDAVSNDPAVAGRLQTIKDELDGGPSSGQASGPRDADGTGGGPSGVLGESGSEGQGAQRPGTGDGARAVADRPADEVAPAPLKTPNRKPETLHDFLISRGGFRPEGGEFDDLAGIHHRAGGRLINPGGEHWDYARMAARDAGFPVGDDLRSFADAVHERDLVRPEDAADQAGRRQAASEAAREDEARYDARDEVAKAIDAAGVRLSRAEIDHATDLVMHKVHPDDAIRQASDAAAERALRNNAARNAFGSPGAPLAEQQSLGLKEESGPTQNFDAAAAARYRKANAAHAERVGTFEDDETAPGVADVLAPGSRSGTFKLGDSEVPSAVFSGGADGAEAADALIKAAGSPEAALKILGDYPAFSLRARAERLGRLSVPDYEKWVKANSAALDKFPELKARFATAADASRALDALKAKRAELDRIYPLKPGWSDADVISDMVRTGAQGYESAERLLRETGSSPAATEAVRDYLAGQLHDMAVKKSGPDAGTLDLGGYERFMKRYGSFLSHPAMAPVRDAFETAAKAQEALESSARQHAEMVKNYQDSVARHFLNTDADPVAAIGGILGKRDPGIELADLGRQTAGDPVARRAIQSAVIQHIKDQVSSNNLAGGSTDEVMLRSDKLQNLVRKLVGDGTDGPLRHVMEPDQMRALKDLADDMQMIGRKVTGPANAEGSQTGLVTHGRGDHGAMPVSLIAMLETFGELGHEMLGSKGKVLGMLSTVAAQAMRKAGLGKIDDLVAAALQDPAKMSALWARLPDEAQAPSRAAAIRAQIAALAAVSATRAGAGQQQQ